jgi:NDP-mannose synthase
MMAVILAGGKGTRLEPFTFSIPKPLMPLGETPILEVVIEQLKASGVDRVALLLGHMSHYFTSFVEKWDQPGFRVDCVQEEEPLGTAGAIALVDELDEDFLVLNGDLLTTLDFGALLKLHRDSEAWGTIAVSRRELRVDYGVVHMNARNELERYEEKPTITYDVSMGINVLSRRSVDLIPRGRRFDLPDLMLALLGAGRKVLCHPTSCYWQDVGRFDDFQQASSDFVENPSRFLP